MNINNIDELFDKEKIEINKDKDSEINMENKEDIQMKKIKELDLNLDDKDEEVSKEEYKDISPQDNKLYKIIAYDLVDTREDLLNVNKKPILHKILKIYVYKILSNLFDKLDKIKRIKKIKWKKALVHQLILIEKIVQKYQKKYVIYVIKAQKKY